MKIKDSQRLAEYLEKYPVQKHFSKPVEKYLELHTFKRGEYVCEERKIPEKLYFLVEGRVKLYLIHQDGNVTLVQYYEPGDILGELELLGMRDQSQSIQAVSNVVCLALPFSECKELMLSDSIFLQNLCCFMAGKMQRSVDKLVNTQTYPLENRLAAYLLEKESEVEDDQWLKIRLTDLAQYLGTSYRHLSRVIKQFDDTGWIEKERTRIRIVDSEALMELTEQMETE